MSKTHRTPKVRRIKVAFKEGQYKAVCDYAKAWGNTPEQAVVSLAMLGAVNWFIDNGNKYKKFHKKKNIMFVTMMPRPILPTKKRKVR